MTQKTFLQKYPHMLVVFAVFLAAATLTMVEAMQVLPLQGQSMPVYGREAAPTRRRQVEPPMQQPVRRMFSSSRSSEHVVRFQMKRRTSSSSAVLRRVPSSARYRFVPAAPF